MWRALTIALATTTTAAAVPATAPATPTVVRAGGPSAPDEAKVAVVASERNLGVAYEDRRANYVTSEPTIDSAAAMTLLLAALEGA